MPELKVINKAKVSVLLLDGEELVGAKQNRVVNTTILLKKESETVIPVSCTEQGRWSYVSEEFADSGTVLSPRMRMVKTASVNVSLNASQRYESDQMAVWDQIEDLSERAQTRSATGAMRHVYESRAKDLEKYRIIRAYQVPMGGISMSVKVDSLKGQSRKARSRRFCDE